MRGSCLSSAASHRRRRQHQHIAASARRLGSTFLLYWVHQDGVVAWVVTADGKVRAHRTRVLRSRLDELIRSTSPSPDTRQSATTLTTTAWRELYDILIRPVRDGLPEHPVFWAGFALIGEPD